ncbi:MAG: type 1 glutamine amidotransferase [Acidobacteriota bacterium]
MRIVLAHSDSRPFEAERFGAAWRAAGFDPEELVPLTPLTPAGEREEVLDAASGVLLSGGPDVEPWRYGSAPDPRAEVRPDPPRDALDIALLAGAEERGLAVLAICYGLQVLNVYHGGTLVQDLTRAGFPGHSIGEPKDAIAHDVHLVDDAGPLLGLPRAFGANSRHHQAVDRLAAPLRTIAIAPDGLIEAVTLEEPRLFVLGVQWHPENMRQGEHLDIFRRFRAACR